MSKKSDLYFEVKTIRDKVYAHGQGEPSNANRINALNHLASKVPGYAQGFDRDQVEAVEVLLYDFIDHLHSEWRVDAEKNEIHDN